MYDLLMGSIIGFSKSGKKVFSIYLSSSDLSDFDIWDSFNELLFEIKSVVGYDFDWFAVETDEGNGVIHLLVSGVYLPVEWLRNKWNSIHSSYLVRQKELLDCDDVESLDGFVVYLCTQVNIVNVGWSDNWFGKKRVFKKCVDGVNRVLS